VGRACRCPWRDLFLDRDSARLIRSREALDRARALSPQLPEIERSLGRHYVAVNDFESALEHLEIAARKLPSDARVLLSLSQVHLRRRDTVEYLETMERAASLDPRSSDMQMQLGLAYLNLRRYEEAEERYRLAVTLAPDNRFAHLLRRFNRVFWRGVEAYSDPEPEILEAWGIDPNYWHYFIALSLERYDDAQAMVDRSPPAGLVSSNAFLPKELFQAWIEASRGEAALAARSFESARTACAAQIAKQPRDDRAEVCLGHAYAGLGRKEEAIEHGRTAVDLWLSGQLVGYSDPSLQQYELARIYASVGEPERAIELLEEVMGRPLGAHPGTLEFDPFFTSLPDHPRFRALLPPDC
jgi:tetratricopeptide (TPR) repeat protein